MAKIVVEEFNAAHKFVDDIVKFLLPHVVGCNDFVIFVTYHKENFGSEIRSFLSKVCDEAIKSDLYKYSWKVQHLQIEEAKNLDCNRFADRFNIIFIAK